MQTEQMLKTFQNTENSKGTWDKKEEQQKNKRKRTIQVVLTRAILKEQKATGKMDKKCVHSRVCGDFETQ